MADERMFSESWHVIAPQRPALRPDVRAHRQAFRGELWHVLGDPLQNRWFRVRPAAWRFLARLDGRATVEDVWQRCLDADPASTPGQQEVVNLLAQLHGAGLLRSDLPPDSAALFRRLKSRREREVRSWFANVLFLRLPLWDPQRLLERATPLIRLLFSRPAFAAWAGLVLAGAAAVLSRFESFTAQTRNLLAPGNLGWLYLTWTAMKLLHELAHAAAVRRHGGQVRVLGVMLLVFTPVPYVDASAAWSLRAKRDRVFVGLAGVMSDLGCAASAGLVWVTTGPGVVNAVAHNLVVLGSAATLLFNANPLLRFDGYYVLADLLDQANLQQRASRQLRAWCERRVLGRREARGEGRSRREAFWLGTFGAASGIYRIFVLVVILLFVAGQWFGLGLLAALVALAGWGLVPLGRAVYYLFRSPALERCRARAIGVTGGLVALLVAGATLVPAPHRFRAPGVVRATHAVGVLTETDGEVARVLAPPGRQVAAGDPLIELRNPELALALKKNAGVLAEIEARLAWAREAEPAFLEPLSQRQAAARRERAELESRQAALVVRAPQAGEWSAPYLEEAAGLWVPRGTLLGTIVDRRTFHFSSVVPQSAVATLFRGEVRAGEVWLPGVAGSPFAGRGVEIVPAERSRLPAASLGWLAGGEVQVRSEGAGRETTEPFFEVRVPLAPNPALRHLRAGSARFTLPPSPLGLQGWRAFRQLLRERYRL